MSWSTAPIEDIASVKGGKRLPKGHDLSFAPTDHLYIRARDIGNNRVTVTQPVYLTDQTFSKIKNYTVSENDLVVTIVGANIGDVGFISNEFDGANLTENAARLRVNKDLCDPRFLSFQLSSLRSKEKFQLLTGGSAQGKLGLYKISAFEVILPPVQVQKKIAAVLSAYDNLIENNRRRIQLLEQAARLLYKEWFVHLRFPGHEHVKIKDGVPEGWGKKTAFDVMEVLSGGTPKTTIPAYWDGDIPFFTPKDAVDYAYVSVTEKTITEDGLKNCNSKLYPKDTVFITARGTVGKINLAQTDMAMNQSCYALVAKQPLNQQFLYFALMEGVEQFRSRAVGTVFDAIIRDTFKLIPFVVPDEKLVIMFTEHVSPILNQIDILSAKTRKLAEARNLLLPRLMSGEITI